MLKIRLRRMGTKDKPFYRIVAVDARVKRDGKYIESVGYYDPKPNPSIVKLEEEKIFRLLKNGAQPTETVNSIFRKNGILKKWHEIRNNNG